jgi:RNA polymerase sigma-70 factor (ECF subfamily)
MLRLLRSSPRPVSQLGDRSDPLRAVAVRAAAGAPDAQRTFMAEIVSPLLRTVRAVLGSAHPDVEDVLQDAMAAVHTALPGFRGECSTLHFACRIAVQTAMNARRRARFRGRHLASAASDELLEISDSGMSPAEQLAAARRRDALRELLCELPGAQADVLALHTVLGYTVEETAGALGVPLNTVRSRLRNALTKLRERVQGNRALFDVMGGES